MTTPNTTSWLMGNYKTKLSVGVMAADWQQLASSLKPFNPETEWLHIDIMDGNFIPKITAGDWVCHQLPKEFICDVHLMVNHPLPIALQCIKNGAHVITVQFESCENINDLFYELANSKCNYNGTEHNIIRGVSLCPDTSFNDIISIIPNIDMIQLLTLDPRTGAKMKQDDYIVRLKQLNALLEQLNSDMLVSIDGSMSLDLAQESIENGANVIVSGSAIFANNETESNIKLWRSLL